MNTPHTEKVESYNGQIIDEVSYTLPQWTMFFLLENTAI